MTAPTTSAALEEVVREHAALRRVATLVVFTEHGAFFDDLEDPAEREHGTGLLLDGLATFLGEQVAA